MSKSADVLFISRQRIVGRTNGSSAYLLDLAQAVRRANMTPHLVQPSPCVMGRWPFMRLQPEMKVFETHRIRGVLKAGRWVVTMSPLTVLSALRAVISRMLRKIGLRHKFLDDRPRPYSIAKPWTQLDMNYLLKSPQCRPDIVIADYAFQGEALANFPSRPSAIIMHDLFHQRQGKAGEVDSVKSISKSQEVAMLSRAQAVVAIQSEEAAFAAANLPHAKVILAPMAANVSSDIQLGRHNELLFVGSNTAPNIYGLQWFFDHVWKELRQRDPSYTLSVAGTVSQSFATRRIDGVRFCGMVPDLSSLYASAGIVISPLTFGSGLKIKLVDALSQGKAIVATSITVQGVEAQCTDALLIADEPIEFTGHILRLKSDEVRRNLCNRALQVAQRHFTPEACHAEFTGWLGQVLEKCGTADCNTELPS